MKKTFKTIFIILISCYINFLVSNTFAQGLTSDEKEHIVKIIDHALQQGRNMVGNGGYLAALIADAGNPYEYREIYEIVLKSNPAELINPDVINILIRRVPELALQLFQLAEQYGIANANTYANAITAFGDLGQIEILRKIFDKIREQA